MLLEYDLAGSLTRVASAPPSPQPLKPVSKSSVYGKVITVVVQVGGMPKPCTVNVYGFSSESSLTSVIVEDIVLAELGVNVIVNV